MIVSFPKISDKYSPRVLIDVLSEVRNAFQQVNSRRYAQDRVLLAGEDGNTYRLYVDNTGTLQIATVSGNDLD